MRLLVLNVDRDDDLGRKTGIQGPCIGREAVLRAATALAVADPEEADANGMFAAIKEYDQVAADPKAYGAEAVFVAAVTGHLKEGTYADTAMAQQVDQILRETQAQHVILVSDGGEDEHIMPIISTRLKVDGVRRVVVKQARNLEGVFFLFHRLINDEKLQRKFFLPLAFLLIAAGLAIGLNRPQVLLMSALFLGAFYIFVQVFRWQAPLGSFFDRIGRQLQAGKLSFVASLFGFIVVTYGGYVTIKALRQLRNAPEGQQLDNLQLYSLEFANRIYWWVAAAVLIVLIGRVLDEYVRERRTNPRFVAAIMFVTAAAVAFHPVLVAARRHWGSAFAYVDLLTADFFTKLFFGGFLLMVGLIIQRYYQAMRVGRAGVATGK